MWIDLSHIGEIAEAQVINTHTVHPSLYLRSSAGGYHSNYVMLGPMTAENMTAIVDAFSVALEEMAGREKAPA